MAILCLLFTTLFASNPYNLGGVYEFSGQIETIQTQRVRPVYAFTQRGREELKELKEEGYRCQTLPRQTYRCSLIDNSILTPFKIQQRASRYYRDFDLYISDSIVSPELISEGESVVVYRYNKTVSLKGIEYPYYDYQLTYSQNGVLHKMKFGEGLRREEYIVEGDNTLRKIYMTADQHRAFFDQFLISGLFLN